ncbi:MAG: hypothetical protein ACKOSO_10730, partial [Actinomycetota bacterium]
MAARRVVALGPGTADAAPALALEELAAAGVADLRVDGPLHDLVLARGVRHDAAAALIAADDRTAWRLVRADPALDCRPDRDALAARAAAQSLAELWAITVRLRADCPWDREQTPATIVPHTIEEAYEVADAALAGPPGPKLVDELGADGRLRPAPLGPVEAHRGGPLLRLEGGEARRQGRREVVADPGATLVRARDARPAAQARVGG